MLMTAEGRHLGTYDGETREDAVRAMYLEEGFGVRRHFGWGGRESADAQLDTLVAVWGGRAVRVGSIPAPAMLSEGDTLVDEPAVREEDVR
jgi:hypothetical protein